MSNIMVKIDDIDRKIIFELDTNSRQSLSSIGDKINQSKTFVDYRIKKLEENGIINKYYTVIDAFKLGYTCLRLYLIYQYVSENKKKEIIDYFINSKFTWVVGSIQGRYDLAIFFWLKDKIDFYNFWEKTLNLYGDYFKEQSLSLYIKAIFYKPTFFVNNNIRTDTKPFIITGGEKEVAIKNVM